MCAFVCVYVCAYVCACNIMLEIWQHSILYLLSHHWHERARPVMKCVPFDFLHAAPRANSNACLHAASRANPKCFFAYCSCAKPNHTKIRV